LNDVVISIPLAPSPSDPSDPSSGEWTAEGLEALLERAVLAALEDAGVSGAELSVTLLDDAEIQSLNDRYLGKDQPTDVISFSLPGPGGEVVGDIYIGAQQARRQPGPWMEELVRLAIHGTLHVLGHDHPEDEARYSSPMFQVQERLVRDVLS
jgi:probable rRNA maturation factor